VVWNDRQDGRFVCHVMDVLTRQKRTIPHAIYTICPDGRVAVAPDFSRIQDLRPGYGYAGIPDAHANEMIPARAGISRIDMRTGEARLILSVADVAAAGTPHPTMEGAKHYFNHLLFAPDGSRFIFLHRWRPDGGKRDFRTRMMTASPEGKDLRVVDPSGDTSHFIWRDPTHILAWTRPAGKPWGFYLLHEPTARAEQVGAAVMTANGHCTYLPIGDGAEWVLNDTYPQGDAREQCLYLFHVPTGKQVWLGRFAVQKEYAGEWRCDLHPRFSRDGQKVVIDSAHGGNGRQMWILDVSTVVGGGMGDAR
jgi:hypothetical protein